MINLLHGDCLELMKDIPDKSIDMVLCDPPYGTTACKWDTVIPFEPMWNELKRITKDNGAICLFGSEPFSSHLRLSNLKMFKYDWIWIKNIPTNKLNAKKQPLRSFEIISIFYKKQVSYTPQLVDKPKNAIRLNNLEFKNKNNGIVGNLPKTKKRFQNRIIPLDKNYPINIIEEKTKRADKRLHPTEKPVPLLEYLIKTYTLENETVLDFTMGSGSTGVACKNLNRSFIGIEKEEKYFNIARDRIDNGD